MMIIIINVRKTTENEVSILLRILTNYAQLITTTMSFSTNYPDSLTDALVPIQNVGESSEAFLSIDCFITDYEIKGPFPSSSFFKLFMTALLPVLVFTLVCVLFLIFVMVTDRRSKLQRYLAISFISLLFLMHPMLTQSSFSIFRCVNIDKDIRKVRIDTDMD